jgi:hypothetical protein
MLFFKLNYNTKIFNIFEEENKMEGKILTFKPYLETTIRNFSIDLKISKFSLRFKNHFDECLLCRKNKGAIRGYTTISSLFLCHILALYPFMLPLIFYGTMVL